MENQETTVGGVPVRWLEHGSGRPVVLVHGIPTSPALWRHVMPLVRGRCLAWERRGYGSSIPGGVGHDLSLSAQAGYLLEWLDTLDLPERPILVGHDLGGGVAQIAAVRAPDAFSGLVLTDAVCYDSADPERQGRATPGTTAGAAAGGADVPLLRAAAASRARRPATGRGVDRGALGLVRDLWCGAGPDAPDVRARRGGHPGGFRPACLARSTANMGPGGEAARRRRRRSAGRWYWPN